jgi:hypothetical protein
VSRLFSQLGGTVLKLPDKRVGGTGAARLFWGFLVGEVSLLLTLSFNIIFD